MTAKCGAGKEKKPPQKHAKLRFSSRYILHEITKNNE